MDNKVMKQLEELFDETMEKERGYKKINSFDRKKFKQETLKKIYEEYEEKGEDVFKECEALQEALETLTDFDEDLAEFAKKNRVVEK